MSDHPVVSRAREEVGKVDVALKDMADTIEQQELRIGELIVKVNLVCSEREALREALEGFECPCTDHLTVKRCVELGSCTCGARTALSTQERGDGA